ncbi:MAG: hypothetical protein KDA55_04390, partial [Planctomycetales bacterium]|nr:hypothetical protein [Planctomycetales bacterium]
MAVEGMSPELFSILSLLIPISPFLGGWIGVRLAVVAHARSWVFGPIGMACGSCVSALLIYLLRDAA